MEKATVHALVLAGGSGRRLGGVSKADLDVGDRLLDLVLAALRSHVNGKVVVVAPATVPVPDGVGRTMEDPPGGGPLAGIGAGVEALEGESGVVLVVGVDTPGIHLLAPSLLDAAAQAIAGGLDGAIIHGGHPVPYDQFLQAAYDLDALEDVLSAAGASGAGLHGRSVTKVLGQMALVRVPAGSGDCRDLDTPEDLDWWRDTLSGKGSLSEPRPTG